MIARNKLNYCNFVTFKSLLESKILFNSDFQIRVMQIAQNKSWIFIKENQQLFTSM